MSKARLKSKGSISLMSRVTQSTNLKSIDGKKEKETIVILNSSDNHSIFSISVYFYINFM